MSGGWGGGAEGKEGGLGRGFLKGRRGDGDGEGEGEGE